jgi:two-component system, NarL family, response regulator DesR
MDNLTSLLIVDDNPQFLQTISEYLRDHFHQSIQIVGTAENGQSAVEQVIDHLPEVVLLDMKMPDLHGFDVIPLMRQNHLAIKIILTTLLPPEVYAESAEVYEQSAKFAGANAFIPKSLLTTKLIPLIADVLNQKSLRFVSLDKD